MNVDIVLLSNLQALFRLLMQEMLVQSLGQEDPLEKEMAIHSSILAWEIPGQRRATVQGVAMSLTRLSKETITQALFRFHQLSHQCPGSNAVVF